MKMPHLGINIYSKKYGLELTRENYAILDNRNSFNTKFSSLKNAYADENGRFYTDEWCLSYQKLCLENFDLNMAYFSRLDHNKLEEELSRFLIRYKKFQAVNNLQEYNGVSGYYIMVMDKYNQLYIGTTNNIKRRILQHWSKIKPLDRLPFPMYAVNTSVLSVDSFRALDTTRIFAYRTNNIYTNEDKYIRYFSSEFMSNRIKGGRVENNLLSLLQVSATIKRRNLSGELSEQCGTVS